MTIWIDADATPRAVREILVRASRTRDVPVVFVANRWMRKPKARLASTVTVGAGEDVADDHIADHCQEGDLVITADIPLAARAVDAGAKVITPYGRDLDEENVRYALSMRDFKEDLRDAGIDSGGPPPFGESQKRDFANALDRWITRSRR